MPLVDSVLGFLRDLRHTWCLLVYGVSLDNYRDVYLLGELAGLQCRHCGIVKP